MQMKVLFTFGGLPHYLIALLNRINVLPGVEVVVIVPSGDRKTIGQGVQQTDKGMNFKVIYVEEFKTWYGKPFYKELRNILLKEKPDILVTIWPFILGFVFYPFLYLFMKRNSVKLIMKDIPFNVPKINKAFSYYKKHPVYDEYLKKEKNTGTSFYIKTTFITILRKIYYNLIDATVNYTDEGKEIISSYGLHPDKIFATYNSPDTDLLYKAKEDIKSEQKFLPENKHRIIHIGRLVPWKRTDLLIRAFANIQKKYPDAELIIIGNGPQEKELQELISSLHIIDSVKCIGGIYDNKMLGHYLTESTIYVLAGMGGLSINEAMIFGKPIICSVCDGTEKKLVRDGYNGLYFKEADQNSIEEKIDYLFSNPEEIKRMGENSEKIIRDEVNIHTVVNGYMKAFNFVLSK